MFGSYLHYRLVEPLIILTQDIENINWNHLPHPSQGKTRNDEIGRLRLKFDEMITTLQGAKNEIIKKTQQLQLFNEELEQKVNQRTNELELRNKELDAFSYSISHDLRAPLRIISGFSEILLQNHKDRLDGDENHLLNKIVKSSTQMSTLLDNILRLAHLGRKEMKLSVIDMKSMAQATFDEAIAPIHDRKIKFEVGELPFAKADENLVYQAWSNLISNAIKFTGKTENALIQIRGWNKDGENIYCVKDNGAGFDMKYVDKLFKEFKRLHTEKNFEGTGAGLAIVKRAIERHGGRVWAEGKEGEGASFYFALPVDGAIS
jgi:two-component system sensor kinase